ncbi:hypothetical protein ACWGKQ_08765 [Streptomyces sp. NPDC054770]
MFEAQGHVASQVGASADRVCNDAAPADYDSGDHVNLTADGYSSISNAFDLASLGPGL